MKYNPDIHHRRSIRLKDYDYSQMGAYFVTVCVQGHEILLGKIIDGEMRLNPLGVVVRDCWDELPRHYSHVELDTFVVMPNHVHGIIILADADVGAGFKPAQTGLHNITAGAGLKPAPTKKRHGLSEIIRAFKTFSSRHINKLRHAPGESVWQRNYYEHVIRNEKSLDKIREYILTNLLRWELDRNNPHAVGTDEFDRWLDTFKKPPKM
jgi:REP element-mobilizing transposase RayT